MIILISCAKTMGAHGKTPVPLTTRPHFETEAKQNAIYMSQFDNDELGRLLRVNSKLAAENYLRYHDFLSADNYGMPALLSYTGIVFKRICPQGFTQEDFLYAQNHLFITSFLYGLLRPLDKIKNYRLEGNVCLPEHGGVTMFDYWKPLLTDFFINEIKKQGGILVNLASAEMKNMFDWKKVTREVRVITPEFYTLKNGKPATVVIYTKMLRGEMTRFILKNRIEHPDDLHSFEWDGFTFDKEKSQDGKPIFILP